MSFLKHRGRSRDPGERRRVILESARQLFIAKGYEQLGMRQIAEAAQISPALIYKEGWTKPDLLAELIFELNEAQIEAIQSMTLPGREPLTDWVLQVMQYMYDLDITHRELRKLGAAYGWLWSQEQDKRCLKQIKDLTAPLRQLLIEAEIDSPEARISGLWYAYWTGFRATAIYNQDSAGCIALIRPVVEILLG